MAINKRIGLLTWLVFGLLGFITKPTWFFSIFFSTLIIYGIFIICNFFPPKMSRYFSLIRYGTLKSYYKYSIKKNLKLSCFVIILCVFPYYFGNILNTKIAPLSIQDLLYFTLFTFVNMNLFGFLEALLFIKYGKIKTLIVLLVYVFISMILAVPTPFIFITSYFGMNTICISISYIITFTIAIVLHKIIKLTDLNF